MTDIFKPVIIRPYYNHNPLNQMTGVIVHVSYNVGTFRVVGSFLCSIKDWLEGDFEWN